VRPVEGEGPDDFRLRGIVVIHPAIPRGLRGIAVEAVVACIMHIIAKGKALVHGLSACGGCVEGVPLHGVLLT